MRHEWPYTNPKEAPKVADFRFNQNKDPKKITKKGDTSLDPKPRVSAVGNLLILKAFGDPGADHYWG